MTNQERASKVLLEHWGDAQETGQADECDCCAEALAEDGLLMPDFPDLATSASQEQRSKYVEDILEAIKPSVPNPEAVDEFISKYHELRHLQEGILELRTWYMERSEHMYSLYEESLDRQFRRDSEEYASSADYLSDILGDKKSL